MGFRDRVKGIHEKVWKSERAQNIRNRVKAGAQKIPGGTKTVAAAGAGFMGGLAARGFRKGRDAASGGGDTGTFFLIIAFIIFIFDLMDFGGGRYTGFQWIWGVGEVDTIFNIVSSSIFGLFMLIFLINRIIRRDWQVIGFETFSYILFALVMTFLILNNVWIASPKALAHFVFILFFGFTFIRTHEDASATYLWITILMFLDFFAYSWLRYFIFFEYIPFLFGFVIFYVYVKEQNPISILAAVVYVIILFAFVYQDAQDQGGIDWIRDTSGPSMEDFVRDLGNGIMAIINSGQTALDNRIERAIKGDVEEYEYAPVGVYLEDVDTAHQDYNEEDAVEVWGTVTALTLDDVIWIKVGCYTGKDEKTRYAEKVDPADRFPVYSSDAQSFTCIFEKEPGEINFEAGTRKIITFADFNFETWAFLETHFIDEGRRRAMIRADPDIDIFEKYNIEKALTARYTYGPIEIGMETSPKFLIGVSNNDDLRYSTLEISFQNRQGWEGEMTKLNEFILFLPEGVELADPDNDCNLAFKKTQEKCEQELCGELEEEDCSELCDLFNAYSLDLEDPEVERTLEDFDKFKYFRCKLTFDKSRILGNIPITTKYFRVQADYDYILEKSVTANIFEVPE